jgi:rhodanese-related sulfurtransferase
MKLVPLFPLLALGLALAGCRTGAGEPYGTMTMGEVEKVLGQPGVAILDANVPELWEKSHLPGAIHIVGKSLEKVLPADKGARLVFYCTGPK